MEAGNVKRAVLAVLAALGMCLGAQSPALAWDYFDIPEPGAADGWVLTGSTSTLAPVGDANYKDYTFDDDGNVASVVTPDETGDPSAPGNLATYAYDDQGRIVRMELRDGESADAPVAATYTYDYRDNGSCVRYLGDRPVWTSFPESPFGNDYGYGGLTYSLYGLWDYEMQDGHVARATRTFDGGSQTRTYSYTFDDQGRVLRASGTYTETSQYQPSPESYEIEMTYTYNPDGSYTCKDAYEGGYDLYSFNAEGQLTRFEMRIDDDYDGGDEKTNMVRDYEYDEHGNNVRIVDPNATGQIGGRPLGVREYTYMQVPVREVVDVPVSTDPDADLVYRLYNRWTHEHLYTTDPDEANSLQGAGWTYEAVGWSAPKTSDRPIYRLFNEWTGEHLYTTDRDEYDARCADGWTGEGVKLYSADETGQPAWRVRNPWEDGPSAHLYTTDPNERATLLGNGCEDEGICWYGLA